MEEIIGKAATRFTWLTALRGAIAIIFGIIVLARPGAGATALLVVFGVYAALDGIFSLSLAFREGRAGGRWGFWLFEGFVGIALAVIAFAEPYLTLAALVWLVGIRALFLGIVAVSAALSAPLVEHRWLTGLTGGISVLFGILLFAISPAQGILALVWLIGVYAIVIGVMFVALAIGAGMEQRKLTGPTHPQAA